MRTTPNPDLEVDSSRLANWNLPRRRRANFRNLHNIQRRSTSFRASSVLKLDTLHRSALGDFPALRRLAGRAAFCGLAVAQRQTLVFESYAADFGPNVPHSIQSITKTFVHLTIGKLVAQGLIDLDQLVGTYVPEAGNSYAQATIQQLLDMNVANNFADTYEAPYVSQVRSGDAVGYANQEVAMGWRLPPAGEKDNGVREFAASLLSVPRDLDDHSTLYRSSNTDLLGWIAERASGIPWADHIEEIVEAAGLAHALHIGLDCRAVPVLSGAGVMTQHDLLRYGLLLGRGGQGVNGSSVGSIDFLNDSMSGNGTAYRPGLTYRNHLVSNGAWIGHPGYAGQFLMVHPNKSAAVTLFSVLETSYGDEAGYFDEIMEVLSHLLERL